MRVVAILSLLSLRLVLSLISPIKPTVVKTNLSTKNEIPLFVSTLNKNVVTYVKDAMTQLYGDRYYARFAALEIIARVPYFSYTSVLHLYETLGLRGNKEKMKVHFAESWNEMHHLLIMEDLGGFQLASIFCRIKPMAIFITNLDIYYLALFCQSSRTCARRHDN